ncbi:hypothetical protein BGW36DRAFT_369330 [Talaromyces proteolyticus]|uniref:Uncharacterized protein n=1 Tax=Talaromyces proteolyticus TaxID=1131652 RepID=A0AAD4KYR0_9EURO|nr:uncharacterized protein BGW36DRAFT_369330 [Talaromyces proteolyticus]KAH8703432.1 hypothetical protein BGW36DRAFT_369330 [Talaromyces proteolyticus]
MAPSILPRNKMSITQTYYLAHSARSKLSKEASRADHDLRLLVGHANLLDSLMLDLANAEKEQERWFNSTVRNASKPSPKPAQHSHIRWADTVEEESVEDYSDDDSDLSDSDSEFDEEDFATIKSVAPKLSEISEEDIEEEEDDDEEAARLTLTRSPSHKSPPSPPELVEDGSSDSEEDSMPPSPTQVAIDAFMATQKHPAKRSDGLDQSSIMFDHAYIEQGTLIPAF